MVHTSSYIVAATVLLAISPAFGHPIKVRPEHHQHKVHNKVHDKIQALATRDNSIPASYLAALIQAGYLTRRQNIDAPLVARGFNLTEIEDDVESFGKDAFGGALSGLGSAAVSGLLDLFKRDPDFNITSLIDGAESFGSSLLGDAESDGSSLLSDIEGLFKRAPSFNLTEIEDDVESFGKDAFGGALSGLGSAAVSGLLDLFKRDLPAGVARDFNLTAIEDDIEKYGEDALGGGFSALGSEAVKTIFSHLKREPSLAGPAMLLAARGFNLTEIEDDVESFGKDAFGGALSGLGSAAVSGLLDLFKRDLPAGVARDFNLTAIEDDIEKYGEDALGGGFSALGSEAVKTIFSHLKREPSLAGPAMLLAARGFNLTEIEDDVESFGKDAFGGALSGLGSAAVSGLLDLFKRDVSAGVARDFNLTAIEDEVENFGEDAFGGGFSALGSEAVKTILSHLKREPSLAGSAKQLAARGFNLTEIEDDVESFGKDAFGGALSGLGSAAVSGLLDLFKRDPDFNLTSFIDGAEGFGSSLLGDAESAGSSLLSDVEGLFKRTPSFNFSTFETDAEDVGKDLLGPALGGLTSFGISDLLDTVGTVGAAALLKRQTAATSGGFDADSGLSELLKDLESLFKREPEMAMMKRENISSFFDGLFDSAANAAASTGGSAIATSLLSDAESAIGSGLSDAESAIGSGIGGAITGIFKRQLLLNELD